MLGPGKVLDKRYRIRREIASHARAVLFEAEQAYTGRIVTLKLLMGTAREDEQVRDALLDEARLLSETRHPSVVEVLDAGLASPIDPYLVTEMLDGRTLDGLLASKGALPVEQAVAIAIAVGEALAGAHALNRTHGTLTPASIFVPQQSDDVAKDRASGGQRSLRSVHTAAKLLDFGLSPNPLAMVDADLGAMAYAPPERIHGEPGGVSDDVFALGAILFESLTGELPRTRASHAPSPSDHRSEVSAVLGEAVKVALGPPDARYTTIAAMLAALRAAERSLAPRSTSQLPPEQRRKSPRACYVAPVRIMRTDATSVQGRSEDISEGGLLVICADPPVDRELVQARFALPSSGKLVTVAAEARWARAAKAGLGAVGLQFIKPPSGTIDDIRRYIATHVG